MAARALNRTHCIQCNVELSELNAVPQKQGKYWAAKCKNCWNKYYTERNKRIYDPVKERDRALRKNFGITLEEYTEIYNSQGGECAICNQPSDEALHLDHNHTTGDNRGLLCRACNHSLGLLKEDMQTIMNMYEYLMKWAK